VRLPAGNSGLRLRRDPEGGGNSRKANKAMLCGFFNSTCLRKLLTTFLGLDYAHWRSRDPERGVVAQEKPTKLCFVVFSFPHSLQKQAFDASGNEKSQAKMLGFSWSG
jgi:hypothetical protein